MPAAKILSVSDNGIRYQWFYQEKKWFSKGTKVYCQGMLNWSEIKMISVFKRDIFSYDLICLQFQTLQDDLFVEVDEEDPRWLELTDQLPAYLPGTETRKQWFDKVAFPAFSKNWQVIYTKRPC